MNSDDNNKNDPAAQDGAAAADAAESSAEASASATREMTPGDVGDAGDISDASETGTPQIAPADVAPKKSMLGGMLASAYCVIAGGLGVSGAQYNFFSSLEASYVAIVFGLVTTALLIILSKNYVPMLFLFGRNFCIVFALILVALFFIGVSQPSLHQALRLVMQLALVWIVYSTLLQIKRGANH